MAERIIDQLSPDTRKRYEAYVSSMRGAASPEWLTMAMSIKDRRSLCSMLGTELPETWESVEARISEADITPASKEMYRYMFTNVPFHAEAQLRALKWVFPASWADKDGANDGEAYKEAYLKGFSYFFSVFRDKLKYYATTERSRNKRRTIKAIRRRIGLLFAEWEAEEKAGGIPANNGYLYAYAIEKGLDPDGASLSEKDIEALDAVAEYIFTTIEAYLIYSLTDKETALNSLFSHKAGMTTEAEQERLRNETKGQINVLFATEWENAGDGLTTSCEEECNFFGDEATRYAFDFLKALTTDVELAANFRKAESNLTPDDEEEAASMKQAQGTKYNEYIKANTPC